MEDENSTVKKELYDDENICMLKISNGDLWVADTGNATMRLCLILQGKSSPVFIHLPWNKSLSIMSNGRSLCMAMHSCAWTQPQSLQRGKWNHVFTEEINIIALVHNQAEQKEESNQIWVKWSTVFRAVISIAETLSFKTCRICIQNVPGHCLEPFSQPRDSTTREKHAAFRW
jgi:hypothetical protein